MRKVILVLTGLLGFTAGWSQLRVDLSDRFTYWARAEPLPPEVYVIDPSEEALAAMEALLERVQLDANFSLYSAKVPGVVSLIYEGKRWILYHESFMKEVRGGDWAAIGLLVEAVAHHLSYHSFEPGDAPADRLLAADRFTGFLLARMGAGPQDAASFLDRYTPKEADAWRPSRADRRMALLGGFDEAGAVISRKGRESGQPLVIPSFPFPPPRASASHDLPVELLGSPDSLADVDRVLSGAIESCGYIGKSYYAVPGGFALVTRIEQIDPGNAEPLPPPRRWSAQIHAPAEFSIREYLNALFFGRKGNFRVFVFVVTVYPFTQSRKSVGRPEAEKWLTEGLNRLPRKLGAKTFTSDHTCTVLVYEFEVNEVGEARLLDPSAFTSQVHLSRAGLLARLRMP